MSEPSLQDNFKSWILTLIIVVIGLNIAVYFLKPIIGWIIGIVLVVAVAKIWLFWMKQRW